MLVINGIENQTNAHGIGVVHSFSGRLARGYPSLTALYAASFGRDLPLPYISMGGFSDGAGILTPVISNGRSLFNYSLQNRNNFDRSLFDAVLFQHGKSSLQELNNPNNIVTNVRQYESYMDSLISSSQLGKLKAVLDANPTIKFDNKHDSILVALLSYKAGLSLSADFSYGGFDSHDHNDERQATNLAELVSGINYAVDKAGELGIADKVTVVVGSDFSRTPWYNASDDGKDHWSIGSFIIIENKAQFGNYVLGATTDNQQQLKINRRSFNIDDNGIQLLPKHVHQELRRYLGIAGNKYDKMFPLNVADEINFLT